MNIMNLRNLFTKTRYYLFTVQMMTELPSQDVTTTLQSMCMKCSKGFFSATELHNYCTHWFKKYYPEIEVKTVHLVFMIEISRKRYNIYNESK